LHQRRHQGCPRVSAANVKLFCNNRFTILYILNLTIQLTILQLNLRFYNSIYNYIF
jgi:hypothetical protein